MVIEMMIEWLYRQLGLLGLVHSVGESVTQIVNFDAVSWLVVEARGS